MQPVFTLKFLQVLVSLFQIFLICEALLDKHRASLETQRGRKCLSIKTRWGSLPQWRHCKNLITIRTTNTGFTFWEKETPMPCVQQFWPDLALRNKVCLRDRCIKQDHLDSCLGWHLKQYETSSQASCQIFPVSIGIILLYSPFHSGSHRQASSVTNLPRLWILWYSVIVIHEKGEAVNFDPKVFSINRILSFRCIDR